MLFAPLLAMLSALLLFGVVAPMWGERGALPVLPLLVGTATVLAVLAAAVGSLWN